MYVTNVSLKNLSFKKARHWTVIVQIPLKYAYDFIFID